MTSDEALKHSWIQRYTDQSGPSPEDEELIMQNLQAYKRMIYMKKIFRVYITFMTRESSMEDQKEVFEEIDSNHDGWITVEELQNYGLKRGIKINAAEIVHALDLNDDNQLCFREFNAALINIQDFQVRNAFDYFDTDGDGVITFEEMLNLPRVNKSSWAELCEEMQTETIDFDTFKRIVK